MEVSRRRVLLKHLEPARPLRRFVHADVESQRSAAGDQHPVEQETTVGIEQVFKIFNLHKQKKVERISYTREVLIGLASCPEAKKRPEYLPDHPIVLPEAGSGTRAESNPVEWCKRRHIKKCRCLGFITAVVVHLQGPSVTAGYGDIYRFFTGLQVPDEVDESFGIFASDEDLSRTIGW